MTKADTTALLAALTANTEAQRAVASAQRRIAQGIEQQAKQVGELAEAIRGLVGAIIVDTADEKADFDDVPQEGAQGLSLDNPPHPSQWDDTL